MLLCEHFSRLLALRWARYEKKLRSARKSASPDSVHDVRVSIRRLLSTLDILETLFPSRGLTACKRALRDELELFSALRDVHVQMGFVKDRLSAHPELNPFYGNLLHEEQKAMKQIRKCVSRAKTGDVKAEQESMRNKLSALTSDVSVDGTVRRLVLGAAAGAFRRVMRLRSRVDPANTETIHRMRVAFKHFRYMSETLHPHVVKLNRAQAKALHDFQTLLGELQDVEVLMESFVLFLRKQKLPDNTFLPVQMEFLKKRMTFLEAVLCRAEAMDAYGEPVLTEYEKACREPAEIPGAVKGKS